MIPAWHVVAMFTGCFGDADHGEIGLEPILPGMLGDIFSGTGSE